MHATVQVMAYREPEVDQVLSQIIEQEVPEPWTFNVEAWVTEWIDPECGYCTTQDAAMSAPGVDVYDAPQGKLSSRNAAHNTAVENGADVIVAWDADSPPASDDSLGRLLQPFDDPDVVGVCGWHCYNDEQIFNSALNAKSFADWFVLQPMYGHFSAFRAETWDKVGPFKEDIDQTSMYQMRLIEEIKFRRDLAKHGRVVDAFDAKIEADDRRYRCRVDPLRDADPPDFCDRIGEETFAPKFFE